MTTTVKIEAHCGADKEVSVVINDATGPAETFTVQDGETAERYVYDARAISVMEVGKEKKQ